MKLCAMVIAVLLLSSIAKAKPDGNHWILRTFS